MANYDRRPTTETGQSAIRRRSSFAGSGSSESAFGKITGMKVLITAASVAATVGGWAQIAHHDSEAANVSQQSAVQAAVQTSQPLLQIDSLALPTIPPVPTLVPAPDFSSLALSASGASNQAAMVVPTLAPSPPTPMPPTPVAAQPSVQQQPLRQVTAPQPIPQARTRSSR